MPKVRFSLPVLLILCLTACTAGRSTTVATPSSEGLDSEQQAVYAAVLQTLYGAPTYVIMAATATDLSGVGNPAQTLDYVVQNMHGITSETLDSFRVRNDAAYPVRSDMALGVPYILLSQQSRDLTFSQNQSGWEIFYGQYPDAPGITSLSQVGFNASFDQALVYIGTESNWQAGAGYYLLLKKTNGTWSIDQQVMIWVS